MKKVNVKDVEVFTQEIEEQKKINLKAILIIMLLVIVSLVGIFFWSTNVRWNAEIENYNEILYYGQEEIKINKLTGFYGNEVKTDISDTEAILMYCSSEYGGTCVTGDFNNSFENLLRSPIIVINIVILIDLILLFILVKDKYLGNVKTYIIFGIVLVYGLISIGMVIFDFANYYAFVNDSKNVVTGKVVRQLVTENKNEYYPIVEYKTEQGEFTNYILVPLNGQINDDLSDKNEITIYYDKIDNSVCTTKQSLKKYILPLIVGVCYLVMAIIYLIRAKRVSKQ